MPKSKSKTKKNLPTETCNAINKSGKNKDKQCHYPSKHSITYNGKKYEVCGIHERAKNFISKTIDKEEIIKRNPNADIDDESEYQDENKSCKPLPKEKIEEIASSDDEEESCDDNSSDSDTDSDNISDDDLKVGDEYIRPEFNESDDVIEFYDCETNKKFSDKGKIITSFDDKKYYLDETRDYVYNQDIVINESNSEKDLYGEYLGTLTEVNDKKAPIHYYDRYWIIASDFIIDYRNKAYIRCVLTNRAYYHKNGIYSFYGNATPNKNGGFTIKKTKKTITESQK